jgi:hypothetical protein
MKKSENLLYMGLEQKIGLPFIIESRKLRLTFFQGKIK